MVRKERKQRMVHVNQINQAKAEEEKVISFVLTLPLHYVKNSYNQFVKYKQRKNAYQY